jgi:hypothetical protein
MRPQSAFQCPKKAFADQGVAVSGDRPALVTARQSPSPTLNQFEPASEPCPETAEALPMVVGALVAAYSGGERLEAVVSEVSELSVRVVFNRADLVHSLHDGTQWLPTASVRVLSPAAMHTLPFRCVPVAWFACATNPRRTARGGRP